MNGDGGEYTSGEVTSTEDDMGEGSSLEGTVTESEIAAAFGEDGPEINESKVGNDPTLSKEQEAIVQDMGQKGELDPDPGQMGETIIGGSSKRMGEVHVDMPYNSDAKYDPGVFVEQARAQEDGLNQLTVQEFLDNYERRSSSGRSEEGTKVQEQYTDGLKESLIDEKMQEGKSFEQAEEEAAEELAGKAALHNPDQVAGGNAAVVASQGDASVNSALGSLWGHGRASELYSRICEMSKDMTEEEKANTYLNVRIDVHPKS